MKRWLTAGTTILFILLLANPVMATVNIRVNGQAYQSMDRAQIVSDRIMVTPDMVEKILGADVSVLGNSIKIINNKDKLEMTLDSEFANINGKAITLSGAPTIMNTTIMLPARAVFEALGAKVGWQADRQNLTVIYNEQNRGMSAAEILDKMKTALDQCKSYKIKVSTDDNSSKESHGSIETYNTHIDTDIASQAQPFLVNCKIIEHRTDIEDRLGSESDVVVIESGLFLNMGKHQWKKIIEPDTSIAALIDAAGSEDPIDCLQQLRKAGAILSLGNDIRENGNNYWVIHVTMSQEGLPNIACGAMRHSYLWYYHAMQNGKFEKVLKNTQAELSYTVMVDQQTCLPSSIIFDSMRIFSQDASISTSKNNGSCHFYGFGESFTVPDVSSATPDGMPAD